MKFSQWRLKSSFINLYLEEILSSVCHRRVLRTIKLNSKFSSPFEGFALLFKEINVFNKLLEMHTFFCEAITVWLICFAKADTLFLPSSYEIKAKLFKNPNISFRLQYTYNLLSNSVESLSVAIIVIFISNFLFNSATHFSLFSPGIVFIFWVPLHSHVHNMIWDSWLPFHSHLSVIVNVPWGCKHCKWHLNQWLFVPMFHSFC